MNDEFGDRMKALEMAEAGRMFMPLLPVIMRLDGKAFHTYTRGMERPFDVRMSGAMIDVTKYLVDKTAAKMGYTQSDEITLVLWSPTYEQQIFFDGRIQKLVSVTASMASAMFNRLAEKKRFPSKDAIACFDCRAWQVPTFEEAANSVLWREQDATKNSISMAARSVASHNALHGKNSSEMQEILFQNGINWNEYPDFFKRGTYVRRKKIMRELTPEELARIPEQHRPAGPVERTTIDVLPMPPFSKVANRAKVIFDGDDPVLKAPEA